MKRRLCRLGVVATSLALWSTPAAGGREKAEQAPADDQPAAAAAGEEKPKDDTVDWLLDQGAETAPPKPDEDPSADKPAAGGDDGAPSPFARKKDDKLVRRGVITLSNGEQVRGRIGTTRGKPLRVWDPKKKQYRDVPFHLVKSADAEVVWERDEREWHFKESGSDIKEYSGKTYPARELRYKLTLLNGQAITGGIVAPLYVERRDENPALFTLNKRTKGEVGQALAELVYVTRVEFDGKAAAAEKGAKAPKAERKEGKGADGEKTKEPESPEAR